LFLWPVVFWLIATRRFRAAVGTACVAAGVTLGAWAVLGFDGMTAYPHLVSRLTAVVASRGYSLDALASVVGIDVDPNVLPLVVGAAVLAVAVRAGLRGRDDHAFALVVVAS